MQTTPDLDLRAKVVDHPWAMLGTALAAGALAGLAAPRSEREIKRSPIRGAIITGLGAIVFRFVKSYMVGQLADGAKSWIDARTRSPVRIPH